MPTVFQTIKFREQRHVKDLRNPWFRIGLVIGTLLSLLVVAGSLAGLWAYTNLTRNLPSIEVLPSLLEPPDGILLQPTRIYERTHQQVILTLENPAVAGKKYLHVGADDYPEQDRFSQYLMDATIAAYDPGFWEHPGYGFSGWSEGTHPTLAQRLVSDLVLQAEPASLWRNIRERLFAAQVTAHFGREKILEWYLNSAQYGELVYGADGAAHVYFGKSATNLTIAEAAMLTGMTEMPAINPITGSQMLKQPQVKVIQAMLSYGLITEGEAINALKEEIEFKAQPVVHPIAPAFTELVLLQLSSVIPLDRVRRGGFEIVTTLDYGLQMQAVCSSEVQIARLQGIQEPPADGEGPDCDAAQLLPTLHSGEGNPLQDILINVAIIDPHSGQILTLVGDSSSGIEPSYPTAHPAGTILSPFLYLTAFTRGINPATLLWDIPNKGGIEDIVATPNNPDHELSTPYHGPVRARMALVNDYSAASAEVLEQVRVENVWLTEKRFGISIPEQKIANEVTLNDLLTQHITILESVSAYGIFANQGIMAGQPNLTNTSGNNPDGLSSTSILRVMGVDGRKWLDWSTAQARPIISSQFAFLANHVLSDESARWPSLGHPNSLEVGRPAGAKIGKTENGDGSWAVGYIPQLAIGVWVGHSPEITGAITADMPAGLWHAIVQFASKQMSVQNFTMPAGISLVQVCDPSGLLVSELCPAIVQEVFLQGDEPTQEDNLYQKYSVNRETGLLATIFTPADMVEEKVFLLMPPKAVTWASSAGLPIPPDTYDVIYAPQSRSQDVRITSPQIFDHIGGRIRFNGIAAGSGFSYYRLQIGQGLNPQQWIQIGEDVDHPVNNGYLGTWDTTGLEGLYVVQLLVVRQDQQIERDILQLTIDNTPPQVQILTPTQGERITYHTGESIIMQASASDNLVLNRVEFVVDGELQRNLIQPPYIILWPVRLGEHTLLIRAYDLAGNMSDAEISYLIHR